MRRVWLTTVAVTAMTSFGDVLECFRNPPRDCRPEVWLQVAGGNASKEGMTKDLEAIADAGFKGVQLFHEGFRDAGPWPGTGEQIPCMSPKWGDFIHHTACECRRLGLRYMMHLCPGWSMAGGPWVPADKTMREVVVSRLDVSPGDGVIRLPRPEKADDAPWRDYRDTVVVAFPTPEGDVFRPLRPVSVVGSRTFDKAMVRNYYADPIVVKPPDDDETSAANWREAVIGEGRGRFAFPDEDGKVELVADFGRIVTVRTVELSPVQRFNHFWSNQPDVTVRILSEEEGEWRIVSERAMPQSGWQDDKPISLAIPATASRRFKVEILHRHPLVLSFVRFYSGARPDNWEAESAGVLRALMPGGDVATMPGETVASGSITNLTNRMSAEGALDWRPPGGRWTVLRIGNVNSGIRNHPAPPEATGWECDKLSTAGADAHYDGFIGKLTSKGGPLADGLLGGLLMDSWECEAQTWTPGLDRIFRQRWGYGLDAWWPALVGFVVEDRKATSSFYRDWRELLGDLVFENFYGYLSRRARAQGMMVTFQTCGCDVMPADPMKHWKHADEPMCEFWRPRTKFGGVGSPDYKSIRPCVSAARVYGKHRVTGEALTSCSMDWRDEYPRAWKADLDYYFAQGITHLTFENYTHDARRNGPPPGSGYSAIMGTLLQRQQTWWPQMRAVTDWIARTSALLECGRNVSDVLLYLGDRLDHKPPHHLPFPSGFAYDYLNKDAFLERITVKDGLWQTPEGLTWKALWLYDDKDLRPETVAKLEACERAGGRVIRGDIFEGVSRLGLRPQVRAPASLLWQHRETEAEDVYYFADESGNAVDAEVEVRGAGEVLIADPVTADVARADVIAFAGDSVRLRLTMPRAGGRFVIIRRGPRHHSVAAKTCLRQVPIPGPWTLTFARGWGRDVPVKTDSLVSWHQLPGTDEQKSYSGTVTYASDFTLGEAEATALRATLDLGWVEASAEVLVNGDPVGMRWTWPYEFDVAGKLREGVNRLEVKVTGSWHNRLRYDALLPESERKTWTLGWPDPEKSPLQPSGLLGPVSLKVSHGSRESSDSRPGLANPERGWRFEILVGCEPGEKSILRDNWPFPRHKRDGITVAQAYCYLTKYNGTPLPRPKLDALQADFDRARRDGVKFLLRFAYERDTSRLNGPQLPQILAHIAQLKEIVNRNADVIYCLQIGWVGAWGEFHSSANGIEDDPKQFAQVVAATLDILPPNRSTMMRTMLLREQALSVLGGRDENRIGFFNDATLANTVDSGTFLGYPDQLEKMSWGDVLWGKYAENGNCHYERVKRMDPRSPVDGELFWTKQRVDPVRENALAAILRFRDHHYTTFSVVHGNSELDLSREEGSVDRWKRSPVTPDLLSAYGVDCDPAYFDDHPYRTAYDFIRDHLGYRLVAKSAMWADGMARVLVHNYGFAAPVNPRKAFFAVVAEDESVRTYPTDFDCRALSPGTDTAVQGEVPQFAKGARLALWLPDEMMMDRTEYAISLAGCAQVVKKEGKLLNVLALDVHGDGLPCAR